MIECDGQCHAHIQNAPVELPVSAHKGHAVLDLPLTQFWQQLAQAPPDGLFALAWRRGINLMVARDDLRICMPTGFSMGCHMRVPDKRRQICRTIECFTQPCQQRNLVGYLP